MTTAFEFVKSIYEKSLVEKVLPSILLKGLNEEKFEKNFKPLTELKGNMQRGDFHPEGDVLTHSFQTIDSAWLLLQNQYSDYFTLEEKIEILIAISCHDFGKRDTQTWNEQKEFFTHIGHEKAGVSIVKEWLEEMGEVAVESWENLAIFVTEYHGVAHGINTYGTKKIIEFAKKVDSMIGMEKYLVCVSADYNGRVEASEDFLSAVRKELHPNAALLRIALTVEDEAHKNQANLLTSAEIEQIKKEVESNDKIKSEIKSSVLEKKIKSLQEKKISEAIEKIIASYKQVEEISL